MVARAIISPATKLLAGATILTNTSDLFNEVIPLGRLIYMANQKKDRLLNEYLSPMDNTASQFKTLSSMRC